MNRQDALDFSEAFLTVVFAGGVVHGGAYGTAFPGWWPLLVTLVPTVGFATLAGIRRINAGRRNGQTLQGLQGFGPPPGVPGLSQTK